VTGESPQGVSTLRGYQVRTRSTAVYPSDGPDRRLPDVAVLYCTLGLVGESGEVAEKVKKAIREDEDEYLREAERELGDVLWYLARLADELGVSLDEIAEQNLRKLRDRQSRDAITGQGDER